MSHRLSSVQQELRLVSCFALWDPTALLSQPFLQTFQLFQVHFPPHLQEPAIELGRHMQWDQGAPIIISLIYYYHFVFIII